MAVACRCPDNGDHFPPLNQYPVPDYSESCPGTLISLLLVPPNNRNENKTEQSCVLDVPPGLLLPGNLDLHPLPPSPGPPRSCHREGPRPRRPPAAPVHVVGVAISHRTAPVFPTPLGWVRPWSSHGSLVWVGRVVIGRKIDCTSCSALSAAEPLLWGSTRFPPPLLPPERAGRPVALPVSSYRGLSVHPPTDLVVVVLDCWHSPSL